MLYRGVVATVVALIVAGGAVKLAGFIASGSRALYVDGLTCIASMLAALFFYRFVLESEKPADKDHPYGHKGFLVASSFVTLIVYSFIAGVAFSSLAAWGPGERIGLEGIFYAALGLLLYSGAVLLARRVEVAGETLSYFTGSEIIESVVTLSSVALGVYASPLYDYAGSLLLLGFLLYGLYRETKGLLPLISDYVPPELLESIRKEIEGEGLEVKSLRLRPCPDKSFHGDAVVAVPPSMGVVEAHALIDDVEKRIRDKYRASIVIHVEPSDEKA